MPDFTTPPVLSKGSRSYDFAGHRHRMEGSDPEIIEWICMAIRFRQWAEAEPEED